MTDTERLRLADMEERPWILREHITRPRPAWWEVRPRTAASVLDSEDDAPCRDDVPRSGYRGVYRQRGRLTWYFSFQLDNQQHYLGGFATAEDAAIAHDQYVQAHGLARPLLFAQEETA